MKTTCARFVCFLVIGLSFAIGLSSANAQNWPQFRGPNASGVADGKPLPLTWDALKQVNILWKTPVPGISVSSPIVWGDKLFVSTSISSDSTQKLRPGLYGDVTPVKDDTRHVWKILCLNKRNGKVLWEGVAHEGIPRTKRHPKSSQASCTPVTDGNVVVANFGSEGLYAWDMNGKLLWKQDLGLMNAGWFFDPDIEWGAASSPIIYKDNVIVQADIQKDSFVAAFDLKTGKQRWKTMRDELPSWGTPTIYQGKPRNELITHATKFIRGYDPDSGKEFWRLSGNSEITTPTPVVGDGFVIVTNGYQGVQPIYAIKPGGSGDITLKPDQTSSDFISWSTKRGGPYTPTPVIYGEILYSVNNSGILSAYTAKSGEKLYQQRVGNGGSYSASLVAGDGKVILSSEDGDMYVIKAGPKYELLSHNQAGDVVMATPAISDGMIYVRTMHNLLAIGEQVVKVAK
ncbi:MAG: PQQ-binding-like beta-propeller repeat protein [Bryobacteraceae bacterium]|nr:PQQ-binding-like beta-propeller repeat protein [Bryobacteraceae bacterium]